MVLSPRARVPALLVLLGLLGYLAVHFAPDQTHAAGLWPVGLAAGVLVSSRPHHVAWTAAAITALAFLTLALGGYPVLVAAGYACAILVEVLVVRAVLELPQGPDVPSPGDLDLVRYSLAALLGSACGGVLFGLTAFAADFGVGWQVGLAAFTTHLASQLILLALFVEGPHPPGVQDTVERAACWTAAVVLTLVAFGPTHLLAAVFLVLPVLAWSAQRLSMRETLWQLVTVGLIASSLSQVGRGPLAPLQVLSERPVEVAVIPLQVFLIGCVLICLPFAVAVNRQRREATAAAAERERLRRIVAGVTSTAIIETDTTGRITLFNPGAQAMLGYTEDEVLGQWPDMFVSRAEVARQAQDLAVPADLVHVGQAHSRPEAGPREWKYIHKGGEIRTMSMTVAPITRSGGTATGFLLTAEDITERVRTEEALQAALLAERRAVTRLVEVDRGKDAFVSTVSHELRTPITNIVGYLELLLDGAYGETTGEQDQALVRIDANTQRLLELIDDLLTLSSIESLEIDLDRQPVDLRQVILRSSERMDPALTERGQRLDVQLPEDPVVVLGDEQHLERMVQKLAANAVKFTPVGGTIVLRVRAEEDRCAIEVQDTGVGIPPEEQPKLFNRFFRSRYAHDAAVKGSGLGLPIARSIALRHGAEISASSVPGRGSVFTVTFARCGQGPVPSPRSPS